MAALVPGRRLFAPSRLALALMLVVVLLLAPAVGAEPPVGATSLPPAATTTAAAASADGAPGPTDALEGLACDASRDERQRLADALRSGGALAGRTLRLPSGCRILLGSPGAGRAALTLASNTRIECADGSAGFVLARRSCRGGDLPGAACDPANRDADCPGGGRCTDDVAGGPFAPDPDGTYGVIASEERSVATAVTGCAIWVNGISGDSAANGGSGRRYGFCSGGTRAGSSCSQSCSAASGFLAGFACTRDADCGDAAGALCQPAEPCAAAGGSCGPPPPATGWGPSGPGFIDPVDLQGSTGAVVERVIIYDHRKGRFAIRIGGAEQPVERVATDRQLNEATLGASIVQGCTTDATTTTSTPVGILFAEVYEPRPFVDTGIVAGRSGSIVRDNRVAARRVGIRAYSWSTVSGNTVELPLTLAEGASALDDSPAGERLPRGIGLLASGNNTIFTDNSVDAYIGFMTEPGPGYNATVANNRFFNGSGPKVAIPSGSGVILTGNYMAWGSSENVDCTAAGQPLACCTGPASGTCTGPGVIRIGSSTPGARSGRIDHVDITGNLIHSNHPYATSVLFDAAGPRCVKGDRQNESCTNDADCPDVASCGAARDPQPCCTGPRTGTCTSACRATTYANTLLSDNHFHTSTTKQTALDFSRLASGSTTVSGMTVGGNRIARFARGVVLPSDAASIERLDFLANDFSETAAASVVCTGAATPLPCCTAAKTGTCSVFEGWAWSMGERKGDAGLTPDDEQPVTVTLAASPGAELRAGDAIAIAADGTVERAKQSADVAGVALTGGSAKDGSVAVAVSGVTSCRVTKPVTAGARLAIAATPGALEPASDGPAVARALAAADGGTVRCLVAPAR